VFPRTTIDNVSVSRFVIGTNWFLGFSHTTAARDALIRATMTPERMADIIAVFLREGVDTIMGAFTAADRVFAPVVGGLRQAVAEAEQRVGRKCILISTPTIDIRNTPEGMAEVERTFDSTAEAGATICMPHQFCTDRLVDTLSRRINNMDVYCKMIRDRGMIPGLSTHMPETIVYADETDLDIGTYISIYNAAGFLMHLEVEWVHRIIWDAKHPVMTIKPMAAGRLTPLVGLAFNWATIRDIDMVTVGTSSPDEAREVIELSYSILERRAANLQLQETRSKQTVKPQ